MEAEVWVVAGCLFEVSLPGEAGAAGAAWRWADPTPEVTLLTDDIRHGRHHFRFRAEAAGAAAGSVRLGFRRGDGAAAEVVVRVAAERLPGEGGEPFASPVGRDDLEAHEVEVRG